MSVWKLNVGLFGGRLISVIFISLTLLHFSQGWENRNVNIIFDGKPQRKLCFESHPDYVIAKACLSNKEKRQQERYCHTYDSVKITKIGENFGFGVYIPPYNEDVCSHQVNKSVANTAVNHVLLSHKNRLIVCSLEDYTFKRNNCNGRVDFQLLLASPAKKSASSQNVILDENTPKTEKLFQIIPTRKSSHSKIEGLVTVNKAGKPTIKRLQDSKDLKEMKLRKHSMFYLVDAE
jgi:hypothetical protein